MLLACEDRHYKPRAHADVAHCVGTTYCVGATLCWHSTALAQHTASAQHTALAQHTASAQHTALAQHTVLAQYCVGATHCVGTTCCVGTTHCVGTTLCWRNTLRWHNTALAQHNNGHERQHLLKSRGSVSLKNSFFKWTRAFQCQSQQLLRRSCCPLVLRARACAESQHVHPQVVSPDFTSVVHVKIPPIPSPHAWTVGHMPIQPHAYSTSCHLPVHPACLA